MTVKNIPTKTLKFADTWWVHILLMIPRMKKYEKIYSVIKLQLKCQKYFHEKKGII